MTFWKPDIEFSNLEKRKWWWKNGEHTSEELILQASSRHVFVYQEPVLVLATIPDQLDKMRVPQLPEKNHFCLQSKEGKNTISSPTH